MTWRKPPKFSLHLRRLFHTIRGGARHKKLSRADLHKAFGLHRLSSLQRAQACTLVSSPRSVLDNSAHNDLEYPDIFYEAVQSYSEVVFLERDRQGQRGCNSQSLY